MEFEVFERMVIVLVSVKCSVSSAEGALMAREGRSVHSVEHLVGISLLMKVFIQKGMKVHVSPTMAEKVFTSFI